MTKKDIIAALEKANIDHDPKWLKEDLIQLLPLPETVPGESICKQRGCPDAEETDTGHCSICGHPVGELRDDLLAEAS